nr:acetylglucosamine-6-sulfatase [Shewanella sp. 10N.286.48.B5]
MSIRGIVTLLCIVIITSKAHSAVSMEEHDTEKQLNILYIMTDDHAAHTIGAYNGRFAKLNPTPNIDKLAQEGIIYTNTFVTNSICTPSRASILTGQYSQTNGVLNLKGSLSKDRQYLPSLIGDAGYQTAIIGKWHLKKEPAAFDYYEVLKMQGSYFDPTFRTRGKKDWPNNVNQYEGHSSDIVTNLSIDWLKNRNKDKPFMLMHQFKAPHDMFKYAPRYESYLADKTIPEPLDLYELDDRFGSDATRGRNDVLRSVIGTSVSKRNPRRNMGVDLGIDPNTPEPEFTRLSYQKYMKAYLRCVKGVDDNIARLIETLKEIGEYDNTVIIYTSDQGMMLGEHDLQDKRWIFDESIRMPLIVKHPHSVERGVKNDILLNNTDFAPFILDLASLKTPDYMQGRSFAVTLMGDKPQNWRSATYYRYWTHRAYHDVPSHVGLRTKQHKLIFYYGENYLTKPYPYYDKAWLDKTGLANNAISTPAGWELYDLTNDPNELVNVYKNKNYATVIKTMKSELHRQKIKFGETDNDYPHLKQIIDMHWND